MAERTNPANAVEWQSTCQGAQWVSEPPHGVGSTHDSVDKWLGGKIVSSFEVTIWDRPNRYGFKTIKGPIPVQTVIGFESTGENETEMTVDVEAEVGGFFKLAEGLVGKQIDKQLETDFNAMKLLLEGEQG